MNNVHYVPIPQYTLYLTATIIIMNKFEEVQYNFGLDKEMYWPGVEQQLILCIG